jgi:hypothetical protein
MATTFLNARIRRAIDGRPFWSDLLKRDVVAIPDAFTTGTVAVTNGSKTVAGTATAWPITDRVNTTIPSGVSEIGYVKVTPASMANITDDTLLYMDAAGTPEAVAVVETQRDSFIAKFLYPHNLACTVTASTLAGRQFRVGDAAPIFTVRAIHTATELEIDYPWSTTAATAQAYRIVKMYLNFGSDFKDVIVGLDQQTGNQIRLHVSVKEMNYRDPQRTIGGYGGVIELVDIGPNESGVMQFEVYPCQSTARQLQFLVAHQWPEMRADTDRPPFFIDPTVFLNGAIADALRWRSSKDDPFFNPQLARDFEALYVGGVQTSINADESKCLRALESAYDQMGYGRGDAFWQARDPDVMAGSY